MVDTLYDVDGLAWSEQQADLLRRLWRGERVNDAVDWANVIEEIETMGRSELRACESHLVQGLIHLLKLRFWPGSRSAGHWRAEVAGQLGEAGRDFTPSMRQRIDVGALYRTAQRRTRFITDDAGEPLAAVEACPFVLDELLDPEGEVDALVMRLAPALTAAASAP